MERTFLKEVCEYCNSYRYMDSDYGRCGADHYTCDKGVFKSTRDADWYKKAQACKLFKTSYLLSQDTLRNIGRESTEKIFNKSDYSSNTELLVVR